MMQYIHLLQEFLALGGYDTSHLKAGDTDLVTLEEDEELLVVFNREGNEDLFLIFEPGQTLITFGQWHERLEGSNLETFEYLAEVIREILSGNYYVREIRLDDVELALLMCDETNQIMNVCLIGGQEKLQQLNALEYLLSLDYSEAYFSEVRWDISEERNDNFYWWEEGSQHGTQSPAEDE